MSDYPTLLSFDEAIGIVADVACGRALDSESVATPRCHGRVLAQDVTAPLDLPPFDNSAMDGFAVRAADAHDGVRLRLVGEQFAGVAHALRVGEGECVRITTGAPMPEGADTVVIRENVQEAAGVVTITQAPSAGANVRARGEDVRRGEHVLHAGQVLRPAALSLAASLGCESLQVRRKPTVAVYTSGDELVEPGMPLQPGQIYDSNRELLMGLLRADGLDPTAWPRLPDDPRQVEIALRDAACAFDVVITCGAVSAGDKDHIPQVLKQFGQIDFWKIRMKPGMPVLFGRMDQAVMLGLPGNPVSVFATYLTIGRALLDGLQGRTEVRPRQWARLVAPFNKAHPRREFVRARLTCDSDGTQHVDLSPALGSNRLRAVAESNALAIIPDGPQQLAAGSAVEILRYA